MYKSMPVNGIEAFFFLHCLIQSCLVSSRLIHISLNSHSIPCSPPVNHLQPKLFHTTKFTLALCRRPALTQRLLPGLASHFVANQYAHIDALGHAKLSVNHVVPLLIRLVLHPGEGVCSPFIVTLFGFHLMYVACLFLFLYIS